jgi:hypothetical protein
VDHAVENTSFSVLPSSASQLDRTTLSPSPRSRARTATTARASPSTRSPPSSWTRCAPIPVESTCFSSTLSILSG